MVAVTLVCGLDVAVFRVRQKLSSCVAHGEMKAGSVWKPFPMSVDTAHEFIAIHPSSCLVRCLVGCPGWNFCQPDLSLSYRRRGHLTEETPLGD